MDGATRKAYPSDLTDEQWELIELMIPAAKAGGRPRGVEMREIVNAILYLNRSGCQRDMLPHDLPPKISVYEYFAAWRADGTWQRFVDTLREAYRPLAAKSEEPTPSAASIDSQSVKTTECGGVRGYDGGKKITGRKRNIVVDTLGLLLAISVTSAAVDDAAAAPQVLARLTRQAYPRLEVVWADWQVSQPRAGGVEGARRPTPAVAVGDCQTARRGERVCALAEALGGGAYVRLVRQIATAEQRLRATHGFERVHGARQRDSSADKTHGVCGDSTDVQISSCRVNRPFG